MSGTLTKIQFNYRAFDAIRKSPAVMADLRQRGAAVQRAAGDGFTLRVDTNASRGRATIITATHDAREAEATDKALTRALNAGR